ncbi:MAG: transaldolase [Anaerolineaceae bacterium]|nr:transaldolase [Anaerolineaceae bacterium]
MTKLHELNELGQSIWLDYIRRDFMASGELQQWVDRGLSGMTSNPKIFMQAIAQSDEYDQQLHELDLESQSPQEIYEALAIKDVQDAATILRGVYDRTNGLDGYVSLEANPNLAYDTEGTIAEVRRLHHAVNRRNVMFKIPATSEGIPAIRQLISEGININITLMFSIEHYEQVAEAYLQGLEVLAQDGQDLSMVASVASFFVSRVDVKLDPRLASQGASELRGKIAIANAKNVYRRFKELFSGERWQRLAAAGARVQRPLWGSTSVKNPEYPDTLYMDSLIGPDTVNTVPPDALEAFLDHGTVRPALEDDMDNVTAQLARVEELGIDLYEVGQELQREGVDQFVEPFDELLAAIKSKQRQFMRA